MTTPILLCLLDPMSSAGTWLRNSLLLSDPHKLFWGPQYLSAQTFHSERGHGEAERAKMPFLLSSFSSSSLISFYNKTLLKYA